MGKKHPFLLLRRTCLGVMFFFLRSFQTSKIGPMHGNLVKKIFCLLKDQECERISEFNRAVIKTLFHAFFPPVLRSAMRSVRWHFVKPQRGGPHASGKLDISDALRNDMVPQCVINHESTCRSKPGQIAIVRIPVQYWKRNEEGRPCVTFHSGVDVLKTEQQNAEKLRLTSLKEYSTNVLRNLHCRWLCLVV